MKTVSPRVVVVTRPSEYESLLARHGTREQARFFLEQRGQSLALVEERHRRLQEALAAVSAAVPLRWRRAHVDRADLARFVFGPEDVVAVVGQDGLVANAAKYLDGQLVLGINPDPGSHDGVLVPHPPARAAELLPLTQSPHCPVQKRTMAQASLDDGQRLLALNEIFVGHQSHQSARYRLRWEDREEAHSSSGLIVTTGTGATGWARSLVRQRRHRPELPDPTERRLVFLVREPFPSRTTAAGIEAGVIDEGRALRLRSEMNEGGTVFGDGIESDRLDFSWGMSLEVGVAPRCLNLVAA